MAAQTRRRETEKEEIEVCVGCGAEAPDGRFEFGGVGAPNPEEGTTPDDEEGPNTSDFAWHPVCNACHQDPAHRKTKLKVHFFPRAQRRMALLAAQQQVMRDE